MALVVNGVKYTAQDIKVQDDLTVGDDATITDDLSVGGDFDVAGDSSFTGSIDVEDAGDGVGVFRAVATGDRAVLWANSMLAPNLSAGNTVVHFMGKESAARNAGYFGFRYTSDHGYDNFITFGHHSNDNLANLSPGGVFSIGGTTFDATARNVVQIVGSTEPGGSVADAVQLYEKDSSLGAGHGTLGLYTEEVVEAIGTFTPSHKLRIWHNGTEYHIQLDAV